MPGWIPQRLRPLLGPDLDAVDADRLSRLIGVSEESDLDYKQEAYKTTEGDSKEAAYDIVALANAGGGLLIIGVEEDGRGTATEIVGTPSPDRDLGLWLHQVVASRVFPVLTINHKSVQAKKGPVHLVAVQSSPLRPHGVAVGDGAFRYPLRSGTTRRYLSESEISDRYRRRFQALETQEALLNRLYANAAGLFPSEQHEAWSWLIVTCVPDSPGDLELRRTLSGEWQAWVDPALREFPAFGPRRVAQSDVGFRCVRIHDGLQRYGDAYRLGGQLHLDGSGVLAFCHPGGRGALGVPDRVSAVYDDQLFGDLINAVSILSRHALRSGAFGNAILGAGLRRSVGRIVLARSRTSFPGVIGDPRGVLGTEIARHSVRLDAVSVPGLDTVAATRLLATDLTSTFGLPEPAQVTRANELVRAGFHPDFQPAMTAWAEAAGVAVIESTDVVTTT